MARGAFRLVLVVVLIALILLAWQGTSAQDQATSTPISTAPPPTDTPTAVPTNTPLPTNTQTPIPPTNTPLPTATNTPALPTATRTPSNTPVPPTNTPTTAPTSTPTQSATQCWIPFNDGFESGGMAQWTTVDGLAVQSAQVYGGANAALAQSTGNPGYARKTLSCEQQSIYYRVRFKLINKDATTLYLVKFRTTANVSIGGIFITENGRLAYRNDNAAAPHTDPTTIVVGVGAWHEIQIHGTVNGASGQVEVWYDGQPISILTKSDNLGSALIGRVQLGENSAGKTFSLAFDDVCVNSSMCAMVSSPPPTATNTPTAIPSTSTPISTATSTNTIVPTNTLVATSIPTNTFTPIPTATAIAPTSPPSCWTPFADDFESGTLAQWPNLTNLAVQQTDVDTGSWAVSAVSTSGAAAYGRHLLSCDQMSVYGRVRFKILSKGSTTAFNLLRFRTGTPDNSIGGVYVDTTGRLAYRSDAGVFNVVSQTTSVTNGVWHTMEVHFDVANQLVEIWYDGALVADLSGNGRNLGSTPIRRVQLGENNTGRTFDVRFDNVCVDIARCPFTGMSTTPTVVPTTPTVVATSTSPPSATVPPTSTSVITPTTAPPTSTPSCWSAFFDGFESGNMNNWVLVQNNALSPQQSDVDAGSWAVSGTGTASTGAYARRLLICDQMSLYYRTRFNIVSKDATTLYLLKFRTGSDASIGGIYVNGQGRLGYRSDAGNFNFDSTTALVSNGAWHTLEAHFDVTNQLVEIWYDDVKVADLSSSGRNLGVVPIGRAQLGENAPGHIFNVRFDTVCVDVARCPATIPQPTPTPSPTPIPTLPPGDAMAMAAGDIACGTASTGGSCVQGKTSDLILAQQPNVVLLLGDDQYECGELSDFTSSFDPSWGRVKSSIRPAIGNHEYNVQTTPTNACYGAAPGAPGYWAYFGGSAHPLDPGCGVGCTGYYSFDVGAWHVIAINSNCGNVPGGCGAGSTQEKWLKEDLAAHPNSCTLAYWHHPLYSSGQWGNNTSMTAIWQDLYDFGAEVVLAGHDHNYEQFSLQDANGNLDTAFGIREFVVGTGGRNLGPSGTPRANSEVFNRTSFGVLKLILHPNGYDWQFVPAAGSAAIPGANGSGSCHGPKTALVAPIVGSTNASSGHEPPGSSLSNLTRIWLSLTFVAAITLMSIRIARRSSLHRQRRTVAVSPQEIGARFVRRGGRSKPAS